MYIIEWGFHLHGGQAGSKKEAPPATPEEWRCCVPLVLFAAVGPAMPILPHRPSLWEGLDLRTIWWCPTEGHRWDCIPCQHIARSLYLCWNGCPSWWTHSLGCCAGSTGRWSWWLSPSTSLPFFLTTSLALEEWCQYLQGLHTLSPSSPTTKTHPMSKVLKNCPDDKPDGPSSSRTSIYNGKSLQEPKWPLQMHYPDMTM